MYRHRYFGSRIGLLAILVTLVVGVTASPGVAAPTAAPTTAAAPADVFVSLTTDASASSAAHTSSACDWDCSYAGCANLYLVYKIYTVFYDLVRWKLSYHWCWSGFNDVYSVTQSERLAYVGPSMRVGGNLTSFVGPQHRDTVEALYDLRTFEYCPLTGTETSCLWEYHPQIDLYFHDNSYLNLSRMY